MIFVSACLVSAKNIPVIFICIVVVVYKAFAIQKNYKMLAYLVIPFLIFYLPFMIRIYCWTGSPLFPAFAKLFGVTIFDTEAMDAYFQRRGFAKLRSLNQLLYYATLEIKHNFVYNLSPLMYLLIPPALFSLFYRRKHIMSFIILMAIFGMYYFKFSHRGLLGAVIFLLLTFFLLNICTLKMWKLN